MRFVAPCLLLVACAACGRVNYDDAGSRDVPSEATDHDEDNVADAIDNCPAHFNQSQADDDADGVGNACDPRPSAPGDKLIGGGVFADGFGDWTPDSLANWTRQGGVITTTADPDATLAAITMMEAVKTPTVYTSFRVDNYGGSYGHRVQVVITLANNSWTCAVSDGSNGTGMLDFVELLFNGVIANMAAPTISLPVGASGALALERRADTATCSALGTSAMGTGQALAGGVASIRIDVVGMKASMQYAVVYDVP